MLAEISPFALAAEEMPVVKNDMKVFNDKIATGTWMPSLRLVSGKSAMVNAPANLTAGHFYYCKTSNGAGAQDLGEIVTIVPVASRFKAMREVHSKDGAKWVAYFDIDSPEFQEIIKESMIKGNTGSFFGPEYLVWVDGATETGGGWALLHCGNKSAREVASEVEKVVGKGRTLKLISGMAHKGKYSWEVFTVEASNSQLQASPEVTDVVDRIKKFKAETELKEVQEVSSPPVEGSRPQ